MTMLEAMQEAHRRIGYSKQESAAAIRNASGCVPDARIQEYLVRPGSEEDLIATLVKAHAFLKNSPVAMAQVQKILKDKTGQN